MVKPKIQTGILLSLVCLGILSVMPIISDSRPADFAALEFAFCLSVWQVIFATPLFFWEIRSGKMGVFAVRQGRAQTARTIAVSVLTGSMFGLSTYLYVIGIEKAGPATAAIAIQAYPMFAILWEALFLKKRKTPIELMFTLVLVGALYFLGTAGTGKIGNISVWFFLTLGVPLLWSIAHVLIKEELGRLPITPAQVTFFRVVISTLFLAVILALFPPSGSLAGMLDIVLRPDVQLAACVMGLVYYLELIVWFFAVRHIDVSLASSITTPWPAFTMVLAVVFLNDEIHAYQIYTFLLIAAALYGLIFAGIRKGRQSDTAHPQGTEGQ